jgi:hypothetical protein
VTHPAAGDQNTKTAVAEKSTLAAKEKRQEALAPNESALESRSDSAARENQTRRHPWAGPVRQLHLNQDFAQHRIHEDRITRWRQKEPFLILSRAAPKRNSQSIGFNHAKRIFKAKSNEVLLEIFAKRQWWLLQKKQVGCTMSRNIELQAKLPRTDGKNQITLPKKNSKFQAESDGEKDFYGGKSHWQQNQSLGAESCVKNEDLEQEKKTKRTRGILQ